VLKGDDKGRIEAKTEALAAAAQKLGERMYADAQAAAGAQGAAAGAEQPAGDGKKADENVVDAEFTEVKDKK
jgi:molecular chaperone DnaK